MILVDAECVLEATFLTKSDDLLFEFSSRVGFACGVIPLIFVFGEASVCSSVCNLSLLPSLPLPGSARLFFTSQRVQMRGGSPIVLTLTLGAVPPP